MTALHPTPPTSAGPEVRWVAPTDPLVRPMFVELDREHGAHHAHQGHALGDPDAGTAREASGFAPPSGGLVLLVDGGTPVAGGAFRRRDSDTAELTRIWTGPAHRRRGLARRVLTELESASAARGYRRVHLTTGPRHPEARHLCLTAGYTPLYDRTLHPETVGPHPFEKYLTGSFA
ncbi:GNAT family N-acetyltransferase [Pseudonocardia tropica]|uniref:GNAT family N-acetyltransferase n=1 Tax=Pseudonocardia tropica TaxID=681289 RepID=A0ABV1JV87_9PSEU